jgi:hypothetical protein
VRGWDATAVCGCRTDTCAVALMLHPVASVLAGAEVSPMARQHGCIDGKSRMQLVHGIEEGSTPAVRIDGAMQACIIAEGQGTMPGFAKKLSAEEQGQVVEYMET